jgi:hypothetical protein
MVAFAASSIGGYVERADAGHTTRKGTCYGQGYGGAMWCRTAYQWNLTMPVRLVDQFTWAKPHWYGPANSARANWSAANGPQKGAVSWTTYPNATWIYINVYDTPLNAHFAYNYNCDASYYCPANNDKVTWVDYSIIDGDPENMDDPSLTYGGETHIWAHEVGHSLGLAHHGISCGVMMNNGCYPNSSPPYPTSTDLGSRFCSGTSGTAWGIRCIYDWFQN